MIPQELIKKIKQIQIYTSRMVDASFAGQYESVFKGRGMQFDEVREYTPGDDIRTIDWNVTARTGKPYIKKFVEEREMTVIFVVDLSASGDFGTVNKAKNDYDRAAKKLAVLAARKIVAMYAWQEYLDGGEFVARPYADDIDKFVVGEYDDMMDLANDHDAWNEEIFSTIQDEAEKLIKSGKIKFK